jgi:ADP-ribose pyrophosphatase
MPDRTSHALTPWTTRSSREVYRNRWISVREDVAEMPDGRTTIYGVVTMSRAVGVVPLLLGGRVLLVRQWRYVSKEARWEIPTGGVRPGEDLLDAAQRELAEETGHHAGRLMHLSTFYSSKSVCDETCDVYLGQELAPIDPHRSDETEFLETCAFVLAEALGMVARGEVRDAMSVIGLLAAERALRAAPADA